MRNRVRPALRRPHRFWLILFGLAVIVFAFSVWDTAPILAQKFESLRYRVLELLPQPEHTQFLPTPLPTPVRVARLIKATPSPASTDTPEETPTASPTGEPTRTPTRKPAPPAALRPIAATVTLNGVKHDYQRWNNCGPTTLEMALSFFGHNHPQADLAAFLKPDPDDKNVSPDEMAAYVKQDKLQVSIRVNGSTDRIKRFLSNGLPLIVETGFDPPRAHQGWMGHYRLITGYDDKAFITQDSYDGPNVRVEFDALDADWKAFNRTYLIIYTRDQTSLVRTLVGDDWNDQTMYTAALERARQELAENAQDGFAAFNIGTNLLDLNRPEDAASAYDHARMLNLPWRMMWYQFGPYQAYYDAGRYEEVIGLANATLKVIDDLEESHYFKGLALQSLGRNAEARAEYASAVKYNKNYAAAQAALTQLNSQ